MSSVEECKTGSCCASITASAVQKASCCETSEKTGDWVNQIDIICRVALAAFATWLAPVTLAISLSLGMAIGTGYAACRFIQNKPLFPHGQGKPVCAQGYMEYLSGMRFPPAVGSIATATFIAAHMRHDPKFYVPFCGFFLGFCIGIESATAVRDLNTHYFCFIKPKPRSI